MYILLLTLSLFCCRRVCKICGRCSLTVQNVARWIDRLTTLTAFCAASYCTSLSPHHVGTASARAALHKPWTMGTIRASRALMIGNRALNLYTGRAEKCLCTVLHCANQMRKAWELGMSPEHLAL